MKPPNLSGRECMDILTKAGYVLYHIRGSHHHFVHEDTGNEVTVPLHRNIRRSTMAQILKQSGLSAEEFHRLRGKG